MKHIEPNLLEQSKIVAGESLSVRLGAMTRLEIVNEVHKHIGFHCGGLFFLDWLAPTLLKMSKNVNIYERKNK